MPVWQRATQEYVDDGSLVVLGVIQEQHAERCRLYAQWKNLNFPIAQDQLTANGLAVVPVVIFIDEHGIVRNNRPRVKQLEDFVKETFPAPAVESHQTEDGRSAPTRVPNRVTAMTTAASDCALGDELMRWQQPNEIDNAIKAYKSALSKIEDETNKAGISKGQLYFRLGVAHRARFDSADGRDKIDADDFSQASSYWSKAIDENPNQYIWRRRIQQYGPRLEKPYPFYDWVEDARREIGDRGETPVELEIALTESERAEPAKSFATRSDEQINPDPDAKILEDLERLIQVRGTAVPHSIRAGKTARVHLSFVPYNGKWNNEGAPMKVWIANSDQFRIVDSLIEVPNASGATSVESRMVEFEIEASKEANGQVQISGFALYNVCTLNDSQCLFRRLPFRVSIQIFK